MESQLTSTLPEHIFSSLSADVLPVAIAQYFLYTHNVTFGQEKEQVPFEIHSPSWMIAESPFVISEKEADIVERVIPRSLDAFNRISMHMIVKSLFDPDPNYAGVREALFAHLPQSGRQYLEALYRVVIANGHQLLPMSIRPDVQVTTEGEFKIIEINGDGRADKGNTQAVAMYSEIQFGERPLGMGLAGLFAESLSANGKVTVATILPNHYRTEYNSQNRFFAEAAHAIAEGNLNWTTAAIDDLVYRDDGIYLNQTSGLVKVDLIDREFEIPGFKPDHEFIAEKQVLTAHLEGKVGIIGSLLPFNDKYLLSLLFNNKFEAEISGIVGGRENLGRLRQQFAETMYVEASSDPASVMSNYSYFDGLNYVDVLEKRQPFVLKRTGNIEQSTESRGVVISEDIDRSQWSAAVRQAFADGGWVLQRFYPSLEKELAARENFRSKKQVNPAAKFRFAPYYVRDTRDGFLKLGNVLVTGKVEHRQKSNREKHIVHAQRYSAYQTVYVRNGNGTN